MVPAQSVASDPTGWLVPAALLLGPGLVACVLCAPLLAADRSGRCSAPSRRATES
ncbi:MAG: hypothetical protein ABEH78_08575 [Haloferacaceae archaeon]